jgi:hypothetical protein
VEQKTENDNITEKNGRRHRVRSKSHAAFRGKNRFLAMADRQNGFLFLIPASLCGVNQEQPTPSRTACLFCKNPKKTVSDLTGGKLRTVPWRVVHIENGLKK